MRLRVFVIASLIAAPLALPSSAVAATATFPDAADDVAGLPYVDFTGVRISNSRKRIRITYRSQSAGNMIGTESLLLDTNRKRPGPELEIGFARFSEGWTTPLRNWKRDRSAAAKRRWSTSPLASGRCDGTVRLRYNSEQGYTPLTITIKKQKGCVATRPARIHLRSATNAYADYGDGDTWPHTVVDNLPNGSRTFTPWVRQRKTASFVDDPDPVRWWSDVQGVEAQLTAGAVSVQVRHRARPAGRQGWLKAYLDINGDAAPDWLVSVMDSGKDAQLIPTTSEWTSAGRPSSCEFDSEMADKGEAVTSFVIPAECIGTPTQVSLAVEMSDVMLEFNPSDWLTGERAWNGPVAAN